MYTGLPAIACSSPTHHVGFTSLFLKCVVLGLCGSRDVRGACVCLGRDLAADLAQITFDFPFKIPPYFALIIRAISVLEGIALVGNPGLLLLVFPLALLP